MAVKDAPLGGSFILPVVSHRSSCATRVFGSLSHYIPVESLLEDLKS